MTSTTIPLRPTVKTAVSRRTERRPVRRAVFDQKVFSDALLRQRRRAERFEERSLLILVSRDRAAATTTPFDWTPVIRTLGDLTRHTDFVGWFERDLTLGILFTDCDVPPDKTATQVEVRVRQALSERMDRQPHHVSVRFQEYPGPRRSNISEPANQSDALAPAAIRHWTIGAAIKRVLDFVASLSLLVLLAPLLFVTSLAIKLTSPGPVLFRQTRVGRWGNAFTIFKFRTMVVHADSTIHQQYVSQFIKTGAPAAGTTGAAVFKIVNDPRVTRVGRFLRKTSLDELPQLLNVLRGDMSLVGPRPPMPYEVAQYKAWHYRRVVDAKPGMTGLWQVTGRSRTTFDEMVRLDLRYARRCSAWEDIRILLATPRAVISGKGAC
jgi:lipopolysaccharide/colanic/teichoic acid biosynthesis glycosyltransferase